MPFTPAKEIVKPTLNLEPKGFTSASDVIMANQDNAPKQPSKLRTALSTVADFGVGAAKGFGQTAQNVGEMVLPETAPFTDAPIGLDEKNFETTNTAQKVGKVAEQVGEFLVPATKVAKAVKGAGTVAKVAGQVLSDTAVSAAQEGDVAQTAGTSLAFSSLPFVGSLLGKYSKIGESAVKAAESLERTSLRLTPVQKQQLEKTGEDVVKFITEKKITGTPEKRFEQISELYDQTEDKVQSLIKSSNTAYSKEEFKKLVSEIPQRYATTFDNPEVYNQVVRLSDELVKYADNFADTIPLEKVNDLKRAYMKNAFNKAGDQVTNEARLAVGETLYKDVLESIPELKGINKEYTKVIAAKKLLGKAIGRNELGLVGNLISMSAGGAVGSAVGGPMGAAVGAAVGPTVATKLAGTESRSMVGANLQRLGEYVKTLQPDKAGNLVIPKSILQGFISEAPQTDQE